MIRFCLVPSYQKNNPEANDGKKAAMIFNHCHFAVNIVCSNYCLFIKFSYSGDVSRLQVSFVNFSIISVAVHSLLGTACSV